jgi:hypothetical protein
VIQRMSEVVRTLKASLELKPFELDVEKRADDGIYPTESGHSTSRRSSQCGNFSIFMRKSHASTKR